MGDHIAEEGVAELQQLPLKTIQEPHSEVVMVPSYTPTNSSYDSARKGIQTLNVVSLVRNTPVCIVVVVVHSVWALYLGKPTHFVGIVTQKIRQFISIFDLCVVCLLIVLQAKITRTVAQLVYISPPPSTKPGANTPPNAFYIADTTCGIRCILFKDKMLPPDAQVGDIIELERFQVVKGHKNLCGDYHNGYTALHFKEINCTNAIITVRKPGSELVRLPTSVMWVMPPYTRASFICVLGDMGPLQTVLVKGEPVNILEMFAMDVNEIHVKIVFWGWFALHVCINSVFNVFLRAL